MSTLHRITQANVGRAIKAVQTQGLKVIKTEIAPDGTIRLIHNESAAPEDAWSEWKATRHAN